MRFRFDRMRLRTTWTSLGLGVLVGWLSFSQAVPAAAPEFTTVFAAGIEGYHTYRIPVLIVTTNQTMLAFCEGRKAGRGDAGDIDVLLKRSSDGGRTWSAPQLVWSDGENTCGNPAPVVDRRTGVIWLLLTWNLGTDHEREIDAGRSRNTRRVFVTQSADDGKTWAQPRDITAAVKKPDWRWYATGPVNGIQLERGAHSGRLVIPCNHSAPNPTNAALAVSRSHVIYSDDHGQTWQMGGSEDELTNESTIVELADGRLLHNLRSYRGRQQRASAVSADGGLTWSPVRDEPELPEPVCQASLFRYSSPGDNVRGRILFSNPASGDRRENLSVKLSYDEGQTWPVKKTLWQGPAAYSGLAVLTDQSIACLFESGDKSPYETIRLARFPLSWLESSE